MYVIEIITSVGVVTSPVRCVVDVAFPSMVSQLLTCVALSLTGEDLEGIVPTVYKNYIITSCHYLIIYEIAEPTE